MLFSFSDTSSLLSCLALLNISLNILRDTLKGGGQSNLVLLSPAGVSRVYASSLLRYSGGGPGSLRPRSFPRCAIGFQKGFSEFGFAPSLPRFSRRMKVGGMKSPVYLPAAKSATELPLCPPVHSTPLICSFSRGPLFFQLQHGFTRAARNPTS